MLNLWSGPRPTPGQGSFYRSQHELIGVFRVGQKQHRNNVELGRFGRNRSNVWTYAGMNSFGKATPGPAGHAPDGQAGGADCGRHARLHHQRRHRARHLLRLRQHNAWRPRRSAGALAAWNLSRAISTSRSGVGRLHQIRCLPRRGWPHLCGNRGRAHGGSGARPCATRRIGRTRKPGLGQPVRVSPT